MLSNFDASAERRKVKPTKRVTYGVGSWQLLHRLRLLLCLMIMMTLMAVNI